MSELLTRFDSLLKDDGPAAIVLTQWLKPVGGDIIFPPTYAAPSQKKGDPPVYNIDRFGESSTLRKTFERMKKVQTFMDVERTEHGKEHSVCVLDSVPSQANRVEPEFGDAIADEKLVPRVVVKVKNRDDEGKEVEESIDLLQAGHRAADAVVRFSSLADDLGKAIKARRAGDSLPLAKIAPTSLIFGMWDSRATGVKVPRLMTSIIRAYDVFEYKRSAQFFAATDFDAAGVVAERGEKGLKKLADAGMADVPATFGLGGISAKEIRREASLNLVTLRDTVAIVPEAKQGAINKKVSREETEKLQRYLLGLALVALTWFDGKCLNLRQGCQLVNVLDHPQKRMAIHADGRETEFPIDRDTAIQYAKEVARAFVVGQDREAKFDPKKAKEALKKITEESE